MRKVYILRWGHRPRDFRITTHVCMTARAFGAHGVFLTDVSDMGVKKAVTSIVSRWGGVFEFQMGMRWQEVVNKWKEKDGIVVHLTMYGLNIQECPVIEEIRKSERDILVIVGSQKVPRSFYSLSVSDYNLAIGNQPHSEIAALAIFLDRLFKGEQLVANFKDARLKILPSLREKRIIYNK